MYLFSLATFNNLHKTTSLARSVGEKGLHIDPRLGANNLREGFGRITKATFGHQIFDGEIKT